jgi:hypothetical protein
MLSAKASQTIHDLAYLNYSNTETVVDAAHDFLVAGTSRDPRNNVKFDVSGNDLK